MRYGHLLKTPKTDEFRESLSRKELNKLHKWLDSPEGIKATIPLQVDIVKRWKQWEVDHGFDTPQAKYHSVEKEDEPELREIVNELDQVKLKQLKLAQKAVTKKELELEKKRAARLAKRAQQATQRDA